MAGPRQLVEPPSFVPRQYGLLSVVQPRYEEPDQHWRNGVTWETTCGLAGTTFDDYCVTGTGSPTKAENMTPSLYGALPFTVYAEIECSPVGYDREEMQRRVLTALTQTESWQVERAFFSGTVAGGSGGYTLYPHLAHNSDVFDPLISTVQLQMAVTEVTGVAVDSVEAVSRLEDALANCMNSQGIIHVTAAVAAVLASDRQIEVRNGKMTTIGGNLVAIGAGYNGISPSHSDPPTDSHWIYATGPVFAYRSNSGMVGGATFKEMFDRDENTAKIIAERTYLLGFDCCLFGIPVHLGGKAGGTYNSAAFL